jgi:hypothetical protein
MFGLAGVLIGGLWVGLSSTKTWDASLASVQLAIEWGTRIRLMKFLNDALSRNVLRAVGPVYQFRHARLQDRLATAAAASGTTQANCGSGAAVTAGEVDET